MTVNTTIQKNRLHVVDGLRGLAIVSIMLLHNLEHFDVYFLPDNLPDWMVWLDSKIWDILFFLFAGKSYGIFAFLFGLTFFIQLDNQEKKGNDFRVRFAWRLLLLFVFGIINSVFFQGDILTFYAAIGIFLIPFAKVRDSVVLGIAIILLLQPFEWWNVIHAIQNPDTKLTDPESWAYFGEMDAYIKSNSFIDTAVGNVTNGKKAVILWSWENGRFFHIPALFMLGMLAGRRKLFAWTPESKKFWIRILVISGGIWIPLFMVKNNIDRLLTSEAIKRPLSIIETSWTNVAFMFVLVSGFTLLFYKKSLHKMLNVFSPIGRMSLSNYVFQSILGSTIYYGFGLGLYQYTGATYGLLIGLMLAILMGYFCTWWAKRHRHGPLEAIWHKATWMSYKRGNE